jgi:hypothetical protein
MSWGSAQDPLVHWSIADGSHAVGSVWIVKRFFLNQP